MSEAKTKGVAFLNVRAFTVERFGSGGWTATLDRLVVTDRQELANIITVGWYPLALYARLLRALEEAHGAGDFALVVRQGRFQAERDLTTIQRVFLRMANPAFAVEKMGEYWRRFHDSGTWEIERATPTRVYGALVDWGVVDRVLCRELGGYMSRVLELVGAKDVNIEHPRCRAHGDARYEFHARWGLAEERVPVGASSSPSEPPARRGSGVLAATGDAFASSVEKLGTKRASGGMKDGR